ncbi:MAG: hypothetical protein LCH92_20615 [Proteobacteria bacterium]|nr:hypothetical protein [Pseudomonadota bacterium]
MILYKTITLQYGRYLSTGKPGVTHDFVGRMFPTEETRMQRQGILRDLAAARIYLLDHRAANYLDSLRMDVQGMPWENTEESQIKDYLRDIDFPRDCVWIEYDSRQLWKDRITRGLSTMSEEDLNDHHQRAFLIDNRSPDEMTIRLFDALTDFAFLDSPLTLVLDKSQDGRPDLDGGNWHLQQNVVTTRLQLTSGDQQSKVADYLDTHKGHLSYEMVIGFMLFAALAAREDDLLCQDTPSLSAAEERTARKFGKSWMIETLRSHVTIRIGPAGERHLTERMARRHFEEARASGRATPTEHWVAEHERRYANGKVVRVRAHQRGKLELTSYPSGWWGPG